MADATDAPVPGSTPRKKPRPQPAEKRGSQEGFLPYQALNPTPGGDTFVTSGVGPLVLRRHGYGDG